MQRPTNIVELRFLKIGVYRLFASVVASSRDVSGFVKLGNPQKVVSTNRGNQNVDPPPSPKCYNPCYRTPIILRNPKSCNISLWKNMYNPKPLNPYDPCPGTPNLGKPKYPLALASARLSAGFQGFMRPRTAKTLGLGFRDYSSKKRQTCNTGLDIDSSNVAPGFVKRPCLTCFRRRVFRVWPLLGRPCLMCFDFGALKIIPTALRNPL